MNNEICKLSKLNEAVALKKKEPHTNISLFDINLILYGLCISCNVYVIQQIKNFYG